RRRRRKRGGRWSGTSVPPDLGDRARGGGEAGRDGGGCPAYRPLRAACRPPLQCFVAAFSAAHTFCGVAGMVMSSVPMASVMALMTAGGAPIAPASPQPLMPSGLDGDGVFEVDSL